MTRALALLCLALLPLPARAEPLHVTWLWHLEQPIYWPAPNASGSRYQSAWDSLQAKAGGATHPENDLNEIFGKDDRVAAYQWRVRDALIALNGYDHAGAQVSYSGGLIENVASLGKAGQLGYSAAWNAPFKEAQGWTTAEETPRLDLVIFPFHHALLPLVDDRVARRELELYQAIYPEAWNDARRSKGLFPSEMAFSSRLIPALADLGLEWVVVSNAHLSRACADYPWVAGSGGDNIPPPNRADQQNPAQGSYNRVSIDRGVSPANAYPFAYRPHRARYVDPATGKVSSVVVVPAAQTEGWKDGYACYGLQEADGYAATSEAGHPILVLLAHDGDNAFGGGYSYYMECVPNLAGLAAGKGWVPSTVAGYLAAYPPAADDVVHVEDGAWVNADGDFGAPMFWNWNWPPVDATGAVDPVTGWAEDIRNWAVLTAATNVVVTAEDLKGAPSIAKILHPESGGSKLEQAWHFLLGGLNSGYMYYGKVLDMELKPVVAANEAVARATEAAGGWGADATGPTVWIPQRWPDNPGGTNFGPLYKYQVQELGPQTWFWTFVHDVSGTAGATLRYRVDADGANDPATDVNELYAGGPGVGTWTDVAMTARAFPAAPPTPDPEIDTSILPTVIADLHYATVDLPTEALIDYYVEATDARGNVTRSPIQHVYVGSSAGPATPSGPWTPAHPACDEPVTIHGEKAGWVHWGVDGWGLPAEALWPEGSAAYGDGKSVETPLTACAEGFCATFGPFAKDGQAQIGTLDFVFHYADGSWDNHGGADYHVTITPCGVMPPDDAPDAVELPADAAGPDATAPADLAAPDTAAGHDGVTPSDAPAVDAATCQAHPWWPECLDARDDTTAARDGGSGGCAVVDAARGDAGAASGLVGALVALCLVAARSRGRRAEG